MDYPENFSSDADLLMESILADSDINPNIVPSAEIDAPEEGEVLFGVFDDGSPTIERMRRSGMYHDEALEL